jgi:hypothetical protein
MLLLPFSSTALLHRFDAEKMLPHSGWHRRLADTVQSAPAVSIAAQESESAMRADRLCSRVGENE